MNKHLRRVAGIMALIFAVAMIAAIFAGCTDAEYALRASLNNKFRVTLYNGGQPVRSWESTGKVETERGSDGWYFMDAATRKLVRVSGDIVVEQLD